MPEAVTIPRIGQVEITRKALPEQVKGATLEGIPEAPILITPERIPGAKLERVVAHELGHRLRDRIIGEAVIQEPEIFRQAPNADSALTRFITNNTELRDLDIRRAGIDAERIFRENQQGKYTEQLEAKEFNAEVFGCWAAKTCRVSPRIEKIYSRVAEKSRRAAFVHQDMSETVKAAWIVAGAIILAALLR